MVCGRRRIWRWCYELCYDSPFLPLVLRYTFSSPLLTCLFTCPNVITYTTLNESAQITLSMGFSFATGKMEGGCEEYNDFTGYGSYMIPRDDFLGLIMGMGPLNGD